MALEKTKNIYSVPVPIKAITSVVEDNFSHQGPYRTAIDLAVELNTPVLAGADGIVTRVRDDSDKYGNDEKYGQEVNYITVKHSYGEYSEYLHLAKDSATVKVSDRVKRDQKIAETGMSGWLTAPHLHWIVYKHTKDQHGFQGLDIQLQSPLPKHLRES